MKTPTHEFVEINEIIPEKMSRSGLINDHYHYFSQTNLQIKTKFKFHSCHHDPEK